jgi:hypothetical protein
MTDPGDIHVRAPFASWRERMPRLYNRLLIAGISLTFTWMGIALAKENGSLVQGLGAFLVVTGIQIACWLLGIRLEILGNTTEPSVNTHEESTSEQPLDIGESEAAFAFELVHRHLKSAEKRLMHAPVQASKGSDTQTNDLRLRLLDLPATHIAATVLQVSLILEQALQRFGGAEDVMRRSRSVGTVTGGSRTDFFLREGRREFAEAYSSFNELRNVLIHNREPGNDERSHFRVIDFGMRLIRILDAGLFGPPAGESIDALS